MDCSLVYFNGLVLFTVFFDRLLYCLFVLSYNLNLPVSIQIVLLLLWVKSFHLQYQESVQAVSPIIYRVLSSVRLPSYNPESSQETNFYLYGVTFRGTRNRHRKRRAVVPWRYAQSPICQLHNVWWCLQPASLEQPFGFVHMRTRLRKWSPRGFRRWPSMFFGVQLSFFLSFFLMQVRTLIRVASANLLPGEKHEFQNNAQLVVQR